MNIKQIQIQTTPMKLEYKRTPNKMEIDSGAPLSLELSTSPSKLEMKSEQIKVMIDQSQCFEESGLKSIASLISENASIGKQKIQETIGRIVSQGNQMADIASGADPLPDQAIENAFDQFVYDWNIDFIPKSRPEFKVTGGNVDINYVPAKVNNNTQVKHTSINYTATKIDTYVKQYNSIKLSTIDIKV